MKLGIIGSGKIVKDFLTATNKIHNLELAGISTTKRSAKIGQELAQKYGIQKTYTDNQALFADQEIDTVYIAVPNSLHYELAKMALINHKNVICEKPFVDTVAQACELKQLADQQHKIIVEAITNIHLPNYQHLKADLAKIGPIHIVSLNYTQYSSRYDSFLQGEIAPVFDPQKDGGALMDLNIYNIHLAVGLFGMPEVIKYYPNTQKGIDTSGILHLSYADKQATLIASKDSYTSARSFIEGEKGSIYFDGSTGALTQYTIQIRNAAAVTQNFNIYQHRMINEFDDFISLITAQDFTLANKLFTHSLNVMQVLTAAKK